MLQWQSQTIDQTCHHKTHPISRPHGRAMGCLLWAFFLEIWHVMTSLNCTQFTSADGNKVTSIVYHIFSPAHCLCCIELNLCHSSPPYLKCFTLIEKLSYNLFGLDLLSLRCHAATACSGINWVPRMETSRSLQCIEFVYLINTLRPRPNGLHLPDDIFKCIF